MFGVKGVAEDELPAEDATRSLGGNQFLITVEGRPLGPNRQDIALDIEVNTARVDTR
jgi:hypothetical protein